MTQEQKNNPLHGVKLEALVTELVDHYGWKRLGEAINLNCFKSNPSIKSSLKFLRRTEWAREKVERFYLYDYKRLPKASDAEYDIPPRQRNIAKSAQSKQSSPAKVSQQSSQQPPASKPQRSAKATEEKTGGKSPSTFNPWATSKVNKK